MLSFLLLALTAVLAVTLHHAQGKIPSYIHICKRNDPDINKCIINSIEDLRPQLVKGIPELEVPSLEPLRLQELVISRGGAFRAVGTDITIRGASNFEITSLKSDINKMQYIVGLRLPRLRFDAIYDVNAKILSLNLKGKGPIQANTTDVGGTGILSGHKETKNGKTYIKFDSLELKLKMKNYSVRLENLFNGDKALGEAVNQMLNDNKKELMSLLRPRAEKTVAEVLLNIANKITDHFEYDELFPAK